MANEPSAAALLAAQRGWASLKRAIVWGFLLVLVSWVGVHVLESLQATERVRVQVQAQKAFCGVVK